MRYYERGRRAARRGMEGRKEGRKGKDMTSVNSAPILFDHAYNLKAWKWVLAASRVARMVFRVLGYDVRAPRSK